MAKIAKPQIPFKVYRQFAIITLVLTALLALFANGEKREALTDTVGQQQRAAQLQSATAKNNQKPKIERRAANQGSRFAGGDTEDFGAPMIKMEASPSSSLAAFHSAGGKRRGETLYIPGYSQAYLDSLTDAEYERLLQNLQASGMLEPQERERTLANLENASSRRSGARSDSNQFSD